MSDEESHSARKRMWKITSGVFIVFFLRKAPSVRSLQGESQIDRGLDVLTSLSLDQYIKAEV